MHRPSWAGERAQYSYSSPEDLAKTKKTFEVASRLRQRWSQEGASLSLQGYGTLGVCTDSTSVIERVVEGRGPTLFSPRPQPFAEPRHERRCRGRRLRGDRGSTSLRPGVPRELSRFEEHAQEEKSVIERIRTTQPIGDAALAAQLEAMR